MFKLINYIRPGWYYSLHVDSEEFGKPGDPSDEILLDVPGCYETELAATLDLDYQRWLKGIPRTLTENSLGEDVPLKDEYRFVRRNFGLKWAIYIWLLRMLEINNPISETMAFLNSRNTAELTKTSSRKDWKPELSEFASETGYPSPKISVIIPTLNRYDFLKEVLSDLAAQDYENFEVIVVDQSDEFEPGFYESFDLNLKVIRQDEKALWLARNSAIQKSEGELILMSEDDIRFAPDFITKHLRAIYFFDADVSCGIFYPEGSKLPESRDVYRLADQLATGNALIRRRVFETIGLFDRQFEKQRAGDGEFGLRAYLAGFRLIANPEATCVDVKAPSGGLRHFGSWDSWRPSGLFTPRPVPSILYLTRKYFGNRIAIYQLCKFFLPSVVPYRYKRSRVATVIGSLFALILLPILSIPLIRSWMQATKKLEEGAKIPSLG